MFKYVAGGILLVACASVALGQSLIPKEAVFKGKFVGRDVKVEGVLEGVIAVDFTTEVTEDGVVKGTIETTDITIAGVVDGNVLAIGGVICVPTAEVKGVVQCRELTVETGAIISAQVSMGDITGFGAGKEAKKKAATPTTTRRSRRSRR
ncbi:MAG: polymer-forming cytoskeletal protein [Candidatus Stahlbacteria bacterium]|nr:polymer-forming cytoskeletal protein [Candidatus Stahlbacteria bacterium]